MQIAQERYGEARAAMEPALPLLEAVAESSDRESLALAGRAFRAMGAISFSAARFGDAQAYDYRALRIFNRPGDLEGQARALDAIAADQSTVLQRGHFMGYLERGSSVRMRQPHAQYCPPVGVVKAALVDDEARREAADSPCAK